MKKYLLLTLLACITLALSSQNQKRMYLHLKSGSVVEYAYQDIDSITFGYSSEYGIDIQAGNTLNLYYGSSENVGHYMVCLSDNIITDDGLPTVINQHLVRLYFNGNKSDNSNNAILPSGHYVLGTGTGRDSLKAKSTTYIESTSVNENGEIEGNQIAFKSLSADVVNNSNGTSTITAIGVLNDGKDTKVRFAYTGKLAFVNKDPSSYTPLATDVKVDNVKLSGRYLANGDKSYGNYTLTYYNCPLDADGFVIGAGQMINFELLTPYSEHMDISKIAGTYDIVIPTPDAKYVAGKFIGGLWTEAYGMYMAIGTYYTELDKNGISTCYGLASEGTVTVTVDGTKITLVSNLKTADGHKMELSTTTSDSSAIVDATVTGAPKAMLTHSAAPSPIGAERVNVHHPATVFLMKR